VDAPVEQDDESLAASAATGDEHAFEQLVMRYQARVFRLASRLLGGPTDAGDVLQETFMQVHKHLPGFRGDSRFSTWLHRITTNAALMHRRARARRPAQSLEEFLPRFDATGTHAATPAQLQVAAEAEERLDRNTLAERAWAGVDALPDAYRVPFVLRDLEELSTAEVAAVLELEPATVRQRVHRARLMLRGYLGHIAGETR
jgi:RNA polymerase sigma-70 factor (ECF subfamily)